MAIACRHFSEEYHFMLQLYHADTGVPDYADARRVVAFCSRIRVARAT
jgi:hypothetical protein